MFIGVIKNHVLTSEASEMISFSISNFKAANRTSRIKTIPTYVTGWIRKKDYPIQKETRRFSGIL